MWTNTKAQLSIYYTVALWLRILIIVQRIMVVSKRDNTGVKKGRKLQWPTLSHYLKIEGPDRSPDNSPAEGLEHSVPSDQLTRKSSNTANGNSTISHRLIFVAVVVTSRPLLTLAALIPPSLLPAKISNAPFLVASRMLFQYCMEVM